MSFPWNIYLLAFAAGMLATAGSMPFWIRWSRRAGLVDHPGHRKIHRTPTALAGGPAVLSGIVLPLLGAWAAIQWGGLPMAAQFPLSYGFQQRGGQLAALLIGCAAMTALGAVDDRKALSPGIKFLAQAAIAWLVAFTGIRVTLFVDNIVFSYGLTLLWILTVTNAMNFMDNMNGLTGGLGAIACFYFGLHAAMRGQYLVGVLCFLPCGALLGFLPFNYPKAAAFLGDSGSHLVGFLLAVAAILPHFHTSRDPNAFAVVNPLFILAVPLADLAAVVWIRWKIGRPFYIGDNNHLSHRLARRGLSKSLTVLIIWLMAVLAGALSFLI